MRQIADDGRRDVEVDLEAATLGVPGTDETGLRVETATFDVTRVGTRRGVGRVLPVAWALLVVAVVLVGVLGQHVSPEAAPTGQPHVELAVGPSPARTPTSARLKTTKPSDIILDATASLGGLSIKGDVFASTVVWVVISLRDDRGEVRSWTSLSQPDRDGETFRPDYWPSFRISVPVDLAKLPRPLWVEVNAYNSSGRKVVAARSEVAIVVPHFPIRPRTALAR